MLWLFLWLLCGLAAAGIYRSKGRSYVTALLAGFLLGPVAVLLALLTPADAAGQERQALRGGSKKCPQCAELVKTEATVCRFCNYRFT